MKSVLRVTEGHASMGSDHMDEPIRRLVGSMDEAFSVGHKTPPVNFTVGENKLKTLRNLRVLRKK